MGTATSMQNRPTRNAKSKAKSECKCLSCAMPKRQIFDGEMLLICGDEACDLKCATCTNRPTSACKFKTLIVAAVKDEIREGVPA